MQEILSGNHKTLVIKSDFPAAIVNLKILHPVTLEPTRIWKVRKLCKSLKKPIHVRNFLADVIVTLV